MVVVEKIDTPEKKATESLTLPFELRCKNRLHAKLDSGEEIGMFLNRGTVLRGGDHLVAQDGRIIAVKAADEALMEARAADPLQLIRAAYHLGNRHVALEAKPNWLRFARDHVLADMVRGLGLEVDEIMAPFEPESGAYGKHVGHAHGHSFEGIGRGSRIHDMRAR
ncbi:MAG: urease accessory protein UreE [Betaproteobacteria bacterium]|nr:urease accessory protein UreE [Betaproteobacteria bacterium]MDE2622567.1 urease accessory protein UreE [Betaproteobacteria bacterium]